MSFFVGSNNAKVGLVCKKMCNAFAGGEYHRWFTVVCFTNRIGCKSARCNLRDIFKVMDTIYSIYDIETLCK